MSFALALPVALATAPTFALALPVSLAAAPAFALTLTDTHAAVHSRAAVHARAAICLLACLLAGGAFRVGFRRAAVAISTAALATLRQRGACGQ